MLDAFLDFLDGPIQVEDLLPFVFGYIILMWLMFAIWVLIDAKARYENTYISVAFFLLIAPLNFPALIFYLIIRPESEEEFMHHLMQGDQHIEGGVNVPVVNFVGKEGIQMSLQLKIANPELVGKFEDEKANLNVSFEWQSKDESFKTIEKKDITSDSKEYETTEIDFKKKQTDSMIGLFEKPKRFFQDIINAIKISEQDITSDSEKANTPNQSDTKSEKQVTKAEIEDNE